MPDARPAEAKCPTCHQTLIRAHDGEITFLGRLVVSKSGSSVVCRRCKSTEPLRGELAKALAGAVLVPVRARES